MRRRLWLLIACTVVLALGLAACGDDDGGDGTAESGDTSAATEAQEQARASLDEATVAPDTIGTEAELSETPPSDMNIAIMSCGTPPCEAWAAGAAEAADALGWTSDTIRMGIDPSEVTNAWNQVIRADYDGVVSNGIPGAAFRNQTRELAERGVPVINGSSPEEPSDGVVGIFDGANALTGNGNLMAGGMVAFGGEESKAVFVFTEDFAASPFMKDAFIEHLGEICPSCSVDELAIAGADIASGESVQKTVAHLRANPDVTWVVSNASLIPGMANALRGAGLEDRVSIGTVGGSPPVWEAIAGGEHAFDVIVPHIENGWKAIDGLARAIVGDPVQEVTGEPIPQLVLTEDSVGEFETGDIFSYVDGYREQFEALWGVDGSG